MGNMTLFIAGIAILSLGTYLMRLGGAKLGNRLAFSERSQALLSDAATVLLFSVALATTFYEGPHFAGMARVLEAAIAVAVPVGLLGSYLYQFRFFINTFLGKYTDRAVAELNSKKIARSIIWYPTIASFILFVPLVFFALYLGAPVIADIIKALEGTVVIHVLEVVGGGLAAIGIATTVYVIGRKDFLVFFFLAYFMSIVFKSLEITMVTYAIFGVIIALIFVQVQKGKPVAESAGSASATTDFDDDDDYDDGF